MTLVKKKHLIKLFLIIIACWYLRHIFSITIQNMHTFNHEHGHTYIKHDEDIIERSSDKVFYSIKTTGANHEARLRILMDTWIQTVKNQV